MASSSNPMSVPINAASPNPRPESEAVAHDHKFIDSQEAGIAVSKQATPREDEASDARPRVTDAHKSYRVTRVPPFYDENALEEALGAAMSLPKPYQVKIKSLATGCETFAGVCFRCATIECEDIFALLSSGSDGTANPRVNVVCPGEWQLQVVHPSSGQSDCVHIDTNYDGFTPLSPLKHEERHTVDCIAIHGWGSHAFGGFKAQGDSFMWLRDALPYDIPELRVWTYGYKYNLLDDNSIATMDEYAEGLRVLLRDMREQTQASERDTPLIFIAHSLGGLILKEAIISMRSSPDDSVALECIVGLLFFGVPSQGMNTKALANMVGNKPQRLDLARIDHEIGQNLRNTQHERFCTAFDHKDAIIYQFFETVKSPTVAQDPITHKWARTGDPALLVNPDSATFGRSWENTGNFKVSIASDHSGIVKFTRGDRDGYIKVRLYVQNLVKSAVSTIKARQRELDESQEAFLDCLEFSEMKNRTDDISSPETTTFQWIWDEGETDFLEWLSKSSTAFWIQGKPGSGKSTLLKHILETRQEEADQNRELAIGFFFSDRGSAIEHTMEGCLRSLLSQLLREYRAGFRAVLEILGPKKRRIDTTAGSGDVRRLTSGINALTKTFLAVVRSFLVAANTKTKFETILIVVDAMDECDSSISQFQDLLASIAQAHGTEKRRVKICCSSRYEHRMRFFEQFPSIALQKKNHNDIKTFVENNAIARVSQQNFQEPSFKRLLNDIISKADGIILWAKLVLKELLDRLEAGDTVSELTHVLLTIPTDLKHLFTRMLGRIKEQYRAEGISILLAVVCAQRQLQLEELRQLLAFGLHEYESEAAYFLSDEVQHDNKRYEDRINSRCGGFLEVTRTETLRGERGTVRFIHQTVKVFVQNNVDYLFVPKDASSMQAGHFLLLKACTRYLALPCFKDLPLDDPDEILSQVRGSPKRRDRFDPEHPLLEYATIHWISHWYELDRLEVPGAHLPQEIQCDMTNSIPGWTYLDELFTVRQPQHLRNTTLLYLAVENNISNFVRQCITDQTQLNKPCGRFGCLVQAAASEGHEKLLRHLLDCGADISGNSGIQPEHIASPMAERNSPNSSPPERPDSSTALEVALNRRHFGTVKLLLEFGAWTIESSVARVKLIAEVAENRSWDAIELLLSHGADVNGNCSPNGRLTLLHAAIQKFAPHRVLNMLLKRGIDRSIRNSLGETALHVASRIGNDYGIEQLMTTSEDLDAQADDGWTALHYLVQSSKSALVLKGLSKGPDVNKQNSKGWTTLHFACTNGSWDLVDMLLKHGAEVNIPAKSGRTPLFCAIGRQTFVLPDHKHGINCIASLLEHGANPEIVDKRGWTVLHCAVDKNSCALIEKLGTSINATATNSNGWTALHLAASLGLPKMVDCLLKLESPVSAKTNDGFTALQLAAYALQENLHNSRKDRLYFMDVAKSLLKAGADINESTDDGWTPLHFAAKGFPKIAQKAVKIFISEGALVNKANADSWTPLHVACYEGNATVTRILLEHGADIEMRTNDGWSVLHSVADNYQLDVWEELLKRSDTFAKSLINQKTNNGLTALHLAADTGEIRLVQWLLDHRADKDIADNYGCTALDFAIKNAHRDVFNLLRGHAFNGLTVLHLAARRDFNRAVKICIRRQDDLNVQGPEGWTALHEASSRGNNNIIKTLFNMSRTSRYKGRKRIPRIAYSQSNRMATTSVEIEAKATDGSTSLHLAASSGYTNTVRLLLHIGADIESVDDDGYTALLCAVVEGHITTVQKLLARGANSEAQDVERRRPLHLAIEVGHFAIVKLLLDNKADIEAVDEEDRRPLHFAAANDDTEILSLLLDRGANIEAATEFGLCLMHLAARQGAHNTVKILLDRGDDANLMSTSGWAALHYAAWHGHGSVVSMLQAANANVDISTSEGDTPLHLAAERGHGDIVHALALANANLNCQTQNGLLPVQVAEIHGHEKVMEILLALGAEEPEDYYGLIFLFDY